MGLFAKDPEKEIERLRRACDERDEKYIDKCLKRGKESLIQTVRVLGEEQMDSYMPRLIELLSSGDADKRKAAAYALGEMRYSSAVTFLTKRLEEEEDPAVIDEINILQATRLGMKRAVEKLTPSADMVLTDGNMTLDIDTPQRPVIGGDASCYSIGAASVLAKVYRDALMDKYAELYPAYGFARNKGYGTAEHIAAIKEYGLCPIHRRSFTRKWA